VYDCTPCPICEDDRACYWRHMKTDPPKTHGCTTGLQPGIRLVLSGTVDIRFGILLKDVAVIGRWPPVGPPYIQTFAKVLDLLHSDFEEYAARRDAAAALLKWALDGRNSDLRQISLQFFADLFIIAEVSRWPTSLAFTMMALYVVYADEKVDWEWFFHYHPSSANAAPDSRTNGKLADLASLTNVPFNESSPKHFNALISGAAAIVKRFFDVRRLEKGSFRQATRASVVGWFSPQ